MHNTIPLSELNDLVKMMRRKRFDRQRFEERLDGLSNQYGLSSADIMAEVRALLEEQKARAARRRKWALRSIGVFVVVAVVSGMVFGALKAWQAYHALDEQVKALSMALETITPLIPTPTPTPFPTSTTTPTPTRTPMPTPTCTPTPTPTQPPPTPTPVTPTPVPVRWAFEGRVFKGTKEQPKQEPLVGAEVTLNTIPTGDRPERITQTDNQGHYSLDLELFPMAGVYQFGLKITAPGNWNLPFLSDPGGWEAERQGNQVIMTRTITASGSYTIPVVNYAIRREFTGYVKDSESGKGIEGAEIQLFRWDQKNEAPTLEDWETVTAVTTTKTLSNGLFTLVDVSLLESAYYQIRETKPAPDYEYAGDKPPEYDETNWGLASGEAGGVYQNHTLETTRPVSETEFGEVVVFYDLAKGEKLGPAPTFTPTPAGIEEATPTVAPGPESLTLTAQFTPDDLNVWREETIDGVYIRYAGALTSEDKQRGVQRKVEWYSDGPLPAGAYRLEVQVPSRHATLKVSYEVSKREGASWVSVSFRQGAIDHPMDQYAKARTDWYPVGTFDLDSEAEVRVVLDVAKATEGKVAGTSHVREVGVGQLRLVKVR